MKLLNTLDRARARWLATTQLSKAHRYEKTFLGDMLLCQCTFPPQPMVETYFGFQCNNDQCREYVSKRDAMLLERVRLDSASVKGFMDRSSTMRRVMQAGKTGEYMRAHSRD